MFTKVKPRGTSQICCGFKERFLTDVRNKSSSCCFPRELVGAYHLVKKIQKFPLKSQMEQTFSGKSVRKL